MVCQKTPIIGPISCVKNGWAARVPKLSKVPAMGLEIAQYWVFRAYYYVGAEKRISFSAPKWTVEVLSIMIQS